MLILTDATKQNSYSLNYSWNRTQEAMEKYMESYLTFTDRITYLQWVKDWKELYMHLSETIRYEKMSKRTVKPFAKWYTYEGYMALLQPYSYSTKYYTNHADLSHLATLLLVLRNQGKRKSQTLKLASQAASQAQPETV